VAKRLRAFCFHWATIIEDPRTLTSNEDALSSSLRIGSILERVQLIRGKYEGREGVEARRGK
jgi:hypothetical protein